MMVKVADIKKKQFCLVGLNQISCYELCFDQEFSRQYFFYYLENFTRFVGKENIFRYEQKDS